MPFRYYVSFSDHPSPFVQSDGPEKGIIVTEVANLSPPPDRLFTMAASEFNLRWPRLSAVLPYLNAFDKTGWRSVVIDQWEFWTKGEPHSFF